MTEHHTPRTQDHNKIPDLDARSIARGRGDTPVNYPKRDSFFAHKTVRKMHKTCAASEMGRDAFLLVTVIVHTEDAARYRGPVRFYNSQLMETLGFTKWETFNRVRQRAMDSGWLQYIGNDKRQAGLYWVTVPKGLEDVEDTAIEEGVRLSSPENEYHRGYHEGYKAGFIEGIKRGSPGGTTCPVPDPIPVPNPNSLSDHSIGGKTKITSGAISVDPDEVVSAWNKIPGVKPILKVTDERRRKLMVRLRDPEWPWKEAFARLPLPGGEWQPDFDWMLKNSTHAFSIVEGKYEFRAKLNNKGPNHDSRNDTGRPRGSLFER